jgi:hypothetical protein
MKYALLLALILAGCTRPTRTADWFAAHPDATNQVLSRCQAHRQADAECDAAQVAVRRKQDDRLKLFRKGF